MTAGIHRRWVCLALAALFLSPAALGLAPAARPGLGTEVLNIQINVPPTWLVLGDENMSGVLQQQVRQSLMQVGCNCRVNFLGMADDPADLPYLLTIELREWRIDALGYAHCSLAAKLKTPQKTSDLGIYSSSTMKWSLDVPPFRLSSAFEHAAEESIERLGADLARSGLLAGLPSQS